MDNFQQSPVNPEVPGYGGDTKQPFSPIITVKEWMLIMLIMLIPIVNIIMMFVWAFGEGNPTKQNYFKASLLWAAILLVIYAIIFVIIITAAATSSNY